MQLIRMFLILLALLGPQKHTRQYERIGMTIHRWQGTDGELGKAANYSSGEAPSFAANNILTLTGNANNGETVTLDAKTYTFQTSLTDVDGNVLIGTDATESLENLTAAIILGSGAGTVYAASMTLHPTVTAADPSSGKMDVFAKIKGSNANGIVTIEAMADGSWDGAILDFGTEWAITDKVVWDKTSTQPVTVGIGATSPSVRVALAWVQEGYKEDFAAFDFSPDKLVHQGQGRMVVNLPATGVLSVIVIDSTNAIEAMLLDGATVADPVIVAKSGKLTIASTFDDILYLHVLAGSEVDIPVSANEIQKLYIDGGIVSNYRKVTPKVGVTFTGIINVLSGFLTQEGDQSCTQLIVGHSGQVIWNSTTPPIIVDIYDGGVVDFNQDTTGKVLSSLNVFPGGKIYQADHINVTLFRDYRKDVP